METPSVLEIHVRARDVLRQLKWWVASRAFGKAPPRQFLLEQLPKHSVGAEIGVWRGDFSAMLLRTVEPKVLHLIDPWKFEPGPEYANSFYGGTVGRDQRRMDRVHDSVRIRFKRQIASGAVKMHRSASSTAASHFPAEYFDWIYIDGNHQYEFVKKDLQSFYPKVKTGSIIAGDDYGIAGWWKEGVTKAVDEFVAEGFCKTIRIENNQFVLAKDQRTT